MLGETPLCLDVETTNTFRATPRCQKVYIQRLYNPREAVCEQKQTQPPRAANFVKASPPTAFAARL